MSASHDGLFVEVSAPGAVAGEGLDELLGYLGSLLESSFPASVSLSIVGPEQVLLEAYGGHACLVGARVATTAATRYDLASLTKVICTVSLVLAARQRGALALEDPVASWLPLYPVEQTTLWHLLTHTSGLIDHRPFFETLSGCGPIEQAVCAEADGVMPGAAVRYSDLNFMLLGWVLEACLDRPLDGAFAAEVAAPLGLKATGFRPQVDRREIAATELDGDQRLVPGLVWGEVHDGNAFALGGVAGHAGLFGSLGDIGRFTQQVLLAPASSAVLSADSLALIATRQAGSGSDVRGIGWRLEPEGWGTWPPGTIWHTGFTGTSLLVAPALGMAVVLLTNAIHPTRRLEDQAAMRAEVHQLVARALR